MQSRTTRPELISGTYGDLVPHSGRWRYVQKWHQLAKRAPSPMHESATLGLYFGEGWHMPVCI